MRHRNFEMGLWAVWMLRNDGVKNLIVLKGLSKMITRRGWWGKMKKNSDPEWVCAIIRSFLLCPTFS